MVHPLQKGAQLALIKVQFLQDAAVLGQEEEQDRQSGAWSSLGKGEDIKLPAVCRCLQGRGEGARVTAALLGKGQHSLHVLS